MARRCFSGPQSETPNLCQANDRAPEWFSICYLRSAICYFIRASGENERMKRTLSVVGIGAQ